MNTSGTIANLKTADTAAELASLLAADVAQCLRAALQHASHASLVVSGGSTPLPFFQALSNIALEWSRVVITLADERWVGLDHPDSNETFVRQHLLVNNAAPAQLVGLYDATVAHAGAAAGCNERVQRILRKSAGQQFDVVVLGMGGDGHTASLFPHAVGLERALDMQQTDLCAAMNPNNVTQARMTLTLPALLNASHVILHITGQQKLEVLNSAISAANTSDKPICAVFQQLDPEVYWAP